MKLIDEWKACWKLFSVQANTIGGSLAVGYASMYDQLKENFPPKIMIFVTGVVFIVGIVGRVVAQKKPTKEKK